jgi:prepilin-type N-terminal cleavage/methylation domain-containing protein
VNLRKAFTLSEILITIAILGFVAAITIPAMTTDILRTQYETGVKESYALLNNILKKINVDYQCDNDLKCTGIFTTGKTTQTLGAELTKYLKVVLDCDITTTKNCWSDTTNDNFDGTGVNINLNTSAYYYKFIGTNGMTYAVHSYTDDANPDCTNNASTGALGSNSFMSQVCGVIIVDVNGHKKPNTKGKDTFTFYITNGKGPLLYPSGGIDDNMSSTNNYWNKSGQNYCFKGVNTEGKYCTARLIDNGWQMDYYK